MTQKNVLVVNSDPTTRDILLHTLAAEGLRVASARDDESALFHIVTTSPDLIVVDLAGAGRDHFLQRVRRFSSAPLLGLVAPNDQEAIVLGLERGADQVLANSFRPQELCARVRALLRRG